MISEVPHDWHNALISGGRRPALKPQRMNSHEPDDDPPIPHEPYASPLAPLVYRPERPPAPRKDPPMATVTATINAPCGTCLHERICARKPKLAALGHAIEARRDTEIEGITLSLVARIECDAYLEAIAADPIPDGHHIALVPDAPKVPRSSPEDVTLSVPEPAAQPGGEAPAPKTVTGKRPHEFSPEGRQKLLDAIARRTERQRADKAAAKAAQGTLPVEA